MTSGSARLATAMHEDVRQLSLPLPSGGYGAGWHNLPLAAFADRAARSRIDAKR